MSKRIVGEAPKIVNKPLHGVKGTAEAKRAELLKLEIQRYLDGLGNASDAAQLAIDTLERATKGISSSGLHPFHLMGA